MSDTERLNATLATLTGILMAVADHRHHDARIIIDTMLISQVRDCLGQAALLIIHMATTSGITDDQLRTLLSAMALNLALGEGDGDGG